MHPNDQEDLNEVERRLAAWHPGVEGLDADAMLFAAGVAAGRSGRSRLVAPTFCTLLTALAATLSVWALMERNGRLELAGRLRDRDRASDTLPPAMAAHSEPLPRVSPFGYFNMRRRMEQESERAQIAGQRGATQSMPPPPAEPAVLKVGQSARLLDQ